MTNTQSDAAVVGRSVFLSYARGDGKDTASKLRDALDGTGLSIWQDIAQIKGGEWEQALAGALDGAAAMLALLTPCAVGRGGPDCARESDSVCLDEIHYARFAPRPVPIVPVMVRACQPPFIIYRLHYHDFTRIAGEQDFQLAVEALKKDLERAIAGETRYRSFVDRLLPLDFENFLGTKRHGFVGREWLFGKVDAFLTKAEVRALLIEGLAGVGKSSFLAELIHRNPGGMVIAYHCCQADTPVTLSPAEFVCTVASMLAAQHPAYANELDGPVLSHRLARQTVEQDPASAFELGVLAPLGRLPPPDGRMRVLAIDALDEALLRPPATPGGPPPLTILDLLRTRIDRFPRWLKVIATTRPERPVKDRLGFTAEVIAADDPENRKDLDAFIRARLSEPVLASRIREAGRDAEEVCMKLASLAAGNFLYAAQVLDELNREVYAVTDLETLPPTLRAKYAWFLARQFPTEQSFAPLRALLEVLAASQTALPLADLAVALGRQPREMESLLSRLASFLRTEPGSERAYAIHHKSMTEWFTDPAREGEVHFVDVSAGHVRLAARLFAVFEHDGASALSRYAVAHLPAHLAACVDSASSEADRSLRLARLVKFVLDPNIQNHKFQRASFAHAALRLALEQTARNAVGTDVGLVFKAAWGLQTFCRSQLRPERLFDLAAGGDLDAFVSELDVYHPEPAFRDLSLLLGVWLAHDRMPAAALAFRRRLRFAPQTDQDLIAIVDAAMNGRPAPIPPLSGGVSEHEVRRILAEAGGSDLERTSGYQQRSEPMITPTPEEVEAHHRHGGELPLFLSEIHGPRLVAFASANPEIGGEMMLEYIAILGSNQYPIYRDLSLYKLVPSIARHTNPQWIRTVLVELAKAALGGEELEFAEPTALTLAAQLARASNPADFQQKFDEILAGAQTLSQGHEAGDVWGEHKRRLAAAAEAFVQLLGGDGRSLLARAGRLPRGYSGMEAYARMTLAESLLICGAPLAEVEAELFVAETTAQTIQDACFCALTTARGHTLRRRWWSAVLDRSAFDLEDEITRLARGDDRAQWAILHEVGKRFEARHRDPSLQPLPAWMLSARSLRDIARIYQVPIEQVSVLNPGLTVLDLALDIGQNVWIPDPGFRALVAALLSALVLVAPHLAPRQRMRWIQMLVPAARAKPTAFQTVLGRLALAAACAGEAIDVAALAAEAEAYAEQVRTPRHRAYRALLAERLAGEHQARCSG